ncbi:MAG: hypothetical protein V4568_06435 [Pseudomonadota bacterium]
MKTIKRPNRRIREKKSKNEFMARHDRAIHELAALYYKNVQFIPQEIAQKTSIKRSSQTNAIQRYAQHNEMQNRIK